MAGKSKAAPKPALVAESKDAAKAYLESHNLTADEVVTVTPSSGVPTGSAVSRVILTRGMVGHEKRVDLVRKARGAVSAPAEPDDE